MMRSFLLLLVVDLLVVGAGLSYLAPRPDTTPCDLEPETALEVERLQRETGALRRQLERLEALADRAARQARHPGEPPARSPTQPPTQGPPKPPSTAPVAEPQATADEDLDRLEAALEAVKVRKQRALGRQTLRVAITHVFPILTEDQRDGATEAVIAYRDLLTKALLPGGLGIKRGYQEAVQEMRSRLRGVVSRDQADAIVRHYAVPPGPPVSSPPVSPPPVRRR